ncbi:hypothetical protein D3C80_1145620 [compost metagenome]
MLLVATVPATGASHGSATFATRFKLQEMSFEAIAILASIAPAAKPVLFSSTVISAASFGAITEGITEVIVKAALSGRMLLIVKF